MPRIFYFSFMKVGILSFRAMSQRASEEELALQRVARGMGHTCRIFRAKRFQMVFNQDSPWLLYDGKPFSKWDIMITRPSILKNVSLHISLERIALS